MLDVSAHWSLNPTWTPVIIPVTKCQPSGDPRLDGNQISHFYRLARWSAERNLDVKLKHRFYLSFSQYLLYITHFLIGTLYHSHMCFMCVTKSAGGRSKLTCFETNQ